MSSTTVWRVSTWTRFAQRYSALSSAGLLGSKTFSTVTLIARIVAPACSSWARVGPALGFAFGSCAATCAAPSKAPRVPQRSHSEIDRIARQRNVAGTELVCRATQLPRLAADELRQRNRAAVGIDGGPFVRVRDIEGLAPSGAARRAGAETPRSSAPRPARPSRSAARRRSRRRRRAARRDAASAWGGRSAPRRSSRSRRRAGRARDLRRGPRTAIRRSRPRSAAAASARSSATREMSSALTA